MRKLSIFSRGFPLQQADLNNDPPAYPATHPDEVLDEVVPASYPDVSLSMKMCAQRKAGRRQRVSDVCTLPMVTCASSPVTRVSRSSLANEATEEEADFV